MFVFPPNISFLHFICIPPFSRLLILYVFYFSTLTIFIRSNTHNFFCLFSQPSHKAKAFCLKFEYMALDECIKVCIMILISGWVTLSESDGWIYQMTREKEKDRRKKQWEKSLPWPDVNTRHFKTIVPCTWISALMFWSRTHAMSMCFSFLEINDVENTFKYTQYFVWCLAQQSVFYIWLLFVTFCYIPSSQPPQYVPPSSKSKRPPFICALVDEFAAAAFPVGVCAVVVDVDPGEFGAIANDIRELQREKKWML